MTGRRGERSPDNAGNGDPAAAGEQGEQGEHGERGGASGSPPTAAATPGASYTAAGVDIAAGERAVDLMRASVARGGRSEVTDGPGGFAGLFRLDTSRYREPLLASSTDGVGTKVAVAQALDRHDTVGIDLVAMVADDLVVCGAEPLFLTDYIACGRVVPERIAEIVDGVSEGCRQAGCALIGGETAEHPGLLAAGEYDLAGAATGIVEADAVLGPERVRAGDVVVGMASTGLHANGFSLARHVLFGGAATAGPALGDAPPGLGGQPLGDALLMPTRIYARDCLALAARADVHAFAHVTGGGIAANLARVLPAELDAVLDRGTWTPPAIFGFIAGQGGVDRAEMEHTFNMGVGMLGVVARADATAALDTLRSRGVPAWAIGEVELGAGAVRLEGDYRS